MPAPSRSEQSIAHDPVLIGLAGFLAGLGTVVAFVARFDLVKILVFLVVAALILLGAAYIRRLPEEPPHP